MAIQSIVIDPNAQSYANLAELDAAADTKLAGIAAGAEVNPADLADLDSAQNSKLDGIQAGATDDQTGDEMVAAIDVGSAAITREGALDQNSLKIVKTNPVAGEFQVKNVHLQADGKFDFECEDVPEP